MRSVEEYCKGEMFRIINELQQTGILSKMNIQNYEWNAFFKVLSKYFNGARLNDFSPAMNIVMRRSVVVRDLYEEKLLNIEHIIESLIDLTPYGFQYKEIDEIKEEIRREISKNIRQKTINNP